MGTQLGSPILINLDGSFTIPRDGVPHVVGHINPDLRLEHLDAFLQQLNETMAKEKGIDYSSLPLTLSDAAAKVIGGMAEQIKLRTSAVECKLKIECELEPKTNRMTYSFTITGALK